ncbi:MAG TPA: hypothetical protein VHT48_00375, partial [Methylocella sp.]|nr:hypothetical protein [Methylocella sp.]
DDRRRTYNLRHGPAKIVAARKMPLPLPLGDLIAKAGDPEGLAAFRYPQRLVFENVDTGRTQGAAHPFGVFGGHSGQGAMPPVVIAENRVDASGAFRTERASPQSSGITGPVTNRWLPE